MEADMWVMRRVPGTDEHGYVFEVGFYDPEGCWRVLYVMKSLGEAADKVHYLNGGSKV
jgi:hypothetical protein